MKKQILIFGTGGQGVKTIGEILAKAAFLSGYKTYSYPSYTPAARGGDIISSVVISEQEEDFPIVEKANFVFLLSPLILEKIKEKIDKNTKFVLEENTPLPQDIDKKNVIFFKEREDIFSFNLFILGIIQKIIEIPADKFESAIRKSINKDPEKNIESFKKGQEAM